MSRGSVSPAAGEVRDPRRWIKRAIRQGSTLAVRIAGKWCQAPLLHGNPRPARTRDGTVSERDEMTLAERLVGELQRTGRTQRQVALELGLSPQTIANVLHGMRPDMHTLYKLSRFLQEPYGVLLQISGIAPWLDLEQEQAVQQMVEDWPTLQILRLVRELPRERRQRLLQLIQLWLEDLTEEANTTGLPASADSGTAGTPNDEFEQRHAWPPSR